MGSTVVSHCFPINFNPQDARIAGIQNIVATYKMNLPQVGLGGPTLFAPLLTEFKTLVEGHMQRRTKIYSTLLIMSDGAIHDMPKTRELVWELSFMPCSIIIVGIGGADFSAMDELDGDGGTLKNLKGEPCARDIVQFVVFNEAMARGDLAEQVLKEVPL